MKFETGNSSQPISVTLAISELYTNCHDESLLSVQCLGIESGDTCISKCTMQKSVGDVFREHCAKGIFPVLLKKARKKIEIPLFKLTEYYYLD
jgi:hypothetical protein